jgi:hypothetical protein
MQHLMQEKKKPEDDPEEQKILDRKMTCEYLGGICLTTLSRLGIPQVKIRRRVFYRRSDLEKWLSKQVSKPETEK